MANNKSRTQKTGTSSGIWGYFLWLLFFSVFILFSGCSKGSVPVVSAPEGSTKSNSSQNRSDYQKNNNTSHSENIASNTCSGDRSAIEIIKQDTENEGNIPAGSVSEAVIKGDEARVKELLTEKPEILNGKNPSDYGRTPLHYAVIFENESITDLLIKSGADVNLQDNEFQRAPLSYAAISGNCDIARKLLKAGAKADNDAFNAWTPLHEAAMQGWAEMIILLLSSGADISMDDETGKTALHYAAMYGRQAAVNVLLDKGAKIEARDNDRKTPLHLAALFGDKETVSLLLKRGSRVDGADSAGHSPAYYAKENGRDDIYEILVKAGAGKEDISAAQAVPGPADTKGSPAKESKTNDIKDVIIKGDEDLIEHLFSYKNRINRKDNEGLTPLHISVMHGNLKTVEAIIKKGAIINTVDNYGRTPLYYAALYVKPEITALLLKNGANPNIADREGKSPLCIGYSGSRDNGEILKALVKSGCKLNIRDNNGWTALHWAAFYGKEEAVKTLLESGADPLLKNKAGQTPLEMLKSESISQPWLYGEIRDILFMAEEQKRKGNR